MVAVNLAVGWRRVIGLVLGAALALAWGCAGRESTAQAPAAPRFEQIAGSLDPKSFDAEALLVIHYHRVDQKYDKWNVWCWPTGKEGAQHELTGSDSFGRYAVVPFKTKPATAGVIVRRGNWEQKDGDRDRVIAFGDRNIAEVWLVSGDESVHTNPDAIDFTVRLAGAFLDANNRITVAATGLLTDEQKKSAVVRDRTELKRVLPIRSIEMMDAPNSTRLIYAVTTEQPVEARDLSKLELLIEGLPPMPVYARDVLNDPQYLPLNAKLGNTYSADATTFTTWSPVAESVSLKLFEKAGQPAVKTIAMRRGDKGLWLAEVPGDLQGMLYRYEFESYGKRREVPDIHCFAATVDSSYSVIVDLDRLKPQGWDTTPAPVLAKPTDEIIYELHVRDYSIADDACPKELRGTYLGLIHQNPAGNGKVSSGLSHLTDLGVTAVHLLPIQDFPAKVGEYNWGYWTTLFNVPESNYCTNPNDPAKTIVELRTAIQALHRSNIRVILDVVYNHTASSGENSAFDQTVPYFYFRTAPDGRYLNDAGVGNSIADERPMVRKYILDSLKFWANQYRIDGFRFDLIGTHHPVTVRAICDELLAVRPDLTLYGEPWTGGGPTHFPKGAQKGLRMALFNDNIRGAIRGDLDGESTGFATGGGDPAAIRRGVAGSIDDFTTEPIETVNYISAHDNLTFWDKLRLAQPKASDEQLRAMQKLAAGIVLTSQGIAFLHGGCEFARTKNGDNNSYNAGDAVNKFDWQRKAQYVDVYNYTRGLIQLRRAHAAFRMADDQLVRANLKFMPADPLVAYTLNGSAVGDAWKTILVAYNGQSSPQSLSLPPGSWKVVANHEAAGVATLSAASGSVTLPANSMWVAYQD